MTPHVPHHRLSITTSHDMYASSGFLANVICVSFVLLTLSGFAKAETPQRKPNRLAAESSPYLLQHAHNPVDWFPWGEEAFEKAKRENKPVFLSIGYSSCFWCHVMERKVFENEEIANYMNEHFVNIKVDREERPELDEVYMLSLQVYFQLAGSSQGGGWPLSIFLTPDGKPIAGGTYFPPEDMPGRPGFMSVMQQLDTAWKSQKQAVERTADAVAQEVKRLSQPAFDLNKDNAITSKDIAAAVDDVLAHYDSTYGGFDFSPQHPDNPKFPAPSKLMLIQSQLAKNETTPDDAAAKLDHSLRAMAEGGIYDHLGGGFHRYSTDRQWIVPHFEKMLYDNAQLAEVYAEAFSRTRRQQYRDVTEGTFEFIDEIMTDERGAFYSALDAETDGVEGEYYVWSTNEVQEILAPTGYRYFATAYGLDLPSTFEHGHVLYLPRPIHETSQQLGVPAKELDERLSRMRAELLAKRRTRKALRRDDKTLTSWNGLMIRAYARAGKLLQRQDYVDRAAKASLYLLSTLRDREGRLLRSARNHQATLPAYLDDYAFFVSGLLTLYETTQEEKWLNAARLLTDQQIGLFWDRERGGFFFTAHDQETLIARTKTAYDSVIPSGNSVSIQNLSRLATITGDTIYANYANQIVNAFAAQLRQSPGNMAFFALATHEFMKQHRHAEIANGSGNLFAGGVSTPPATTMPSPTNNAAPSSETPDPSAPLIPGLKPVNPNTERSKIQAIGYFSQDKGIPGKEIDIAIEIQIEKDWHINANPAQPEFVIPTELKTTKDAKFKLNAVHYPKGHAFRLEGIDDPLSVYEGKVIITGTLQLPKDPQDEILLEFSLKTQACNNATCLPPQVLQLSGPLKLTASPNDIKPINAKLFQQKSTD